MFSVFLLRQAKFISVPKYAELAVSKVWPLVKEVPELMMFFPNFETNQLPEKEFMWTIL
jgi:hypothetical protein